MPLTSDQLLRSFHRDHAGVTPRAFARGRAVVEDGDGDGPGGSSYDALVREVPAEATVLDLGCGDGYLLSLLRRRGLAAAALTGVDMSPEELALARAREDLAGVSLVETRAQELPMRAGAFSCVVSHLAFTLMSDVEQVVAEVARVLAPGGVFLAMVGGGPKVGDAFELFLDELRPIYDSAREDGRVPRLGDPRARRPDGLRALFCAATGFAAGPEIRDVTVRLDGSFDEVWDSLATVYELYLMSEADRAALKRGFHRRVQALAARAGRIPCGMAMSLVRCLRT